MNRWLLGCAACAVAASGVGCAVRVPVVTTPSYPAFIFPAVPAAYADTRAARVQQEAWAFLQTGDLITAEQRFAASLAEDTDFFPAAAGLGWVDVAGGRFGDAIAHFESALGIDASYAPALVGLGQVLLRTGDSVGALRNFEAALAVDSGLMGIGRLVGELQLQVMSERLAQARNASDEGRLAVAEMAYREVISTSPDSAFLYLELARLKQRQGAVGEALTEVRRARQLDDADSRVFLLEGELLESMGELVAAMEVYRQADTLEPSELTASALLRVRSALRVAELPVDYREIRTSAQATRGDFAALLGVQLDELMNDAGVDGTTPIFTDTRNHWASQWIIEVARAGVMRVDRRYQFEPDRPVRRGDLAEIVADTLMLIAELVPEAGQRWRDAQPRLSDMSVGHLNYDSASMAVAAGILSVVENDRFEPTRVVSGREAVDVVERLMRLVEGME